MDAKTTATDSDPVARAGRLRILLARSNRIAPAQVDASAAGVAAAPDGTRR